MWGAEFPWDQITELDLSHVVIEGADLECRACMCLIEQYPLLKILSSPFWDLEVGSSDIPTTYSNALKLNATTVPIPLMLPLLREASLRPNDIMAQYDSFKQLLICSNCMNSLTSLLLASVPLTDALDRTLYPILSQTHSLRSATITHNTTPIAPIESVLSHVIVAFIHSCIVQKYNNQHNADNQEQIVLLVKSLKIIPTKAVIFLPLLLSLDI